MKTIIVTGGIGAGKSMVCAEFAKFGAKVIEGDKIGHDCLAPDGAAYAETVAEFGNEILNADKTISREKLGRIAFADKQRLAKLNEITHKHILREIVEQIDKVRQKCHTISQDANDNFLADLVCDKRHCVPMIVLEIPLFRVVDIPHDAVISVIASDSLRVERVIERNGLPEDVIASIMARQPTNEEYRSFADYCIENEGNIDALLAQAREVYEKINKGMNI